MDGISGGARLAPRKGKAEAADSKASISKIPASAIIHAADAMTHGAVKYGSYNWRRRPAAASVYVDAALRHVLAWFDGEEADQESGAHHLGHAIASLAILLDYIETASLQDDRPEHGGIGPLLIRIENRRKARQHDA